MNAAERSSAIRALMAEGVSRDDANIVVDLSAHTAEQARRTIMAVVETAPLHLRGHILVNALVGVAEDCMEGLAAMNRMGVQMKDIRDD